MCKSDYTACTVGARFRFCGVVLFAVALVSGFLFATLSPARAVGPTYISWPGLTIDTPTTWTKENSPYHVGRDSMIKINSTLTIEPGVVVTFEPLHSR